MEQIQFVGTTPKQLQEMISADIKCQLEEMKKYLQPKEPTKYLTRNEVSEMLSVDLSTVHNLTVKGTLKKYQIGGRVLYKREEIEEAIVRLEN